MKTTRLSCRGYQFGDHDQPRAMVPNLLRAPRCSAASANVDGLYSDDREQPGGTAADDRPERCDSSVTGSRQRKESLERADWRAKLQPRANVDQLWLSP